MMSNTKPIPKSLPADRGEAHGVYAFTGNNGKTPKIDGKPGNDLPASEMHQSILRMTLNRSSAPSHRIGVSHYQLGNWYRLDIGKRFPGDEEMKHVMANGDVDLSSGGPIILDNGLILGGGKQGRIYVTDNAAMREKPPRLKFSFQAFYNTWHPGISPCDYDADQSFGPNIHGSPVAWRPVGAPYSLIYGMPEKDYLKAFRVFDSGRVDERPFRSTMESGIRSPRGMPGGAASLSAEGGTNGIVWVSAPLQDSPDAMNTGGKINGRLMAFDALTLRKLWESDAEVPFAKFVPPTIAGGKVFRAAYSDRIFVYGLTGGPAPPIALRVEPKPRSVSALWRDNDHLDIFMTSRDPQEGSILSTNWEAVCPAVPGQQLDVGRKWTGFFPINNRIEVPHPAEDGRSEMHGDRPHDDAPLAPEFEFLAEPSAPVAALWRKRKSVEFPGPSGHLDLFVVGRDGRVMSNYWEQRGVNGNAVAAGNPPSPVLSGWNSWFAIAPTDTMVAKPGSPVTAVWSTDNRLDLFVTDSDGRAKTIAFENSRWEARWTDISSQSQDRKSHLRSAPGQLISAVLAGGKITLFATADDGSVKTTDSDNRWTNGWTTIGNGDPLTIPGQPIAVLKAGDHVELFMTSKEGRILTASGLAWGNGWKLVGGDSPIAETGQAVTAIRRGQSDGFDLFIVGEDKQIKSIHREGSSPWPNGWFSISPGTGRASAGEVVAAVWSPGLNHLDLFVTSIDGRVISTFFETPQWRPEGWFPL
jgi:hypothetical protein